jgi:hypothetical protein
VGVRIEPPTVAGWLAEWLDGKPDLAEGTRTCYAGHINKYLAPHLGQLRVDKFQARHVEAMFAQIEEANVRILECRESDDEKVRASVRGQRVISRPPSTASGRRCAAPCPMRCAARTCRCR